MMRSTRELMLYTTLAFAGGALSGLLFAPQSGREFRASLLRSTRKPTGWVEERLHQVEVQLAALEAQVQTTSTALSQRFREATGRALDSYRPSFSELSWDVKRGELARDLRYLPRR